MVYAPNLHLKYPLTDQKNPDLPVGEGLRMQDPQLLRVARRIYHVYLEVHAKRMRRPSGVAIHTRNYRGSLIFSPRPILLPGECFIPFEQIESEIY